jgi:SlyX protein
MTMDARLSEIEIKLSFNEELLEELNRTVARQQQQIVALAQQLRDLQLQLQRSLPAESGSPDNEIPPHY